MKRREFIQKASVGAIGTTLISDPFIQSLENLFELAKGELTESLSASYDLIDHNSLLSLRLYFFNVKTRPNKLKRKRGEDAFLMVRIPQQHITEHILTVASQADIDKHEQLASFLSGYSYLSFKWPEDMDEMTIDPDTFMSWEKLQLLHYDRTVEGLSVEVSEEDYPLNIGTLLKGDYKKLLYPGTNLPITLIENPYKLYLSPVNTLVGSRKDKEFVSERVWIENNYKKRQLHSDNTSRKHVSLTEVWTSNVYQQLLDEGGKAHEIEPHYKIAAYTKLNGEEANGVKLIPGTVTGEDDRKLLALLTQHDKYDENGKPVLPPGDYWMENGSRDVIGKRNELTALGASTRYQYWNLEAMDGKSLVGWKQFSRYGRDNYIEITQIGVDANTGLKCLYVVTGEREIDIKGRSFVRRHEYIRFVDKEHNYAENERVNGGNNSNYLGIGYNANNLPFKKIKVLTHEKEIKSRKIDGLCKGDEPSGPCKDKPGQALLTDLPTGGKPAYFQYLVTDYNDNEFEISMPVAFIFKGGGLDRYTDLKDKIFPKMYAASGNSIKYHTYLSARLPNQKMAFAPFEAGDDGKLENETQKLKPNELVVSEIAFYFGFEYCTEKECLYKKEFSVFPQMRFVKAELPQLMGISDKPNQYYFRYSNEFIEHLFGTFSQVFLEAIDGDKLSAGRSADQKNKPIINVFRDGYRNTGKLMNSDLVIEGVSVLKQSIGMKSEMRKGEGKILDTSTKMIDPGEVLRGLNTEIIGGIDIKDILSMILPLDDMPQFDVFDQVRDGFEVVKGYDSQYKEFKQKVDDLEKKVRNAESSLRNHIDTEAKKIGDKVKAKLQLSHRYKIALENDFSTAQEQLKKQIEAECKAAYGKVATELKKNGVAGDINKIKERLVKLKAVATEAVTLWMLIKDIDEKMRSTPFTVDAAGNKVALVRLKLKVENRLKLLKSEFQETIVNEFNALQDNVQSVLNANLERQKLVGSYINMVIQGELLNIYAVSNNTVKKLLGNVLHNQVKAVLAFGGTYTFTSKNLKGFFDLVQQIKRERLPIDSLAFKSMMREIGKDLESSLDSVRIKEAQVRREIDNFPDNFKRILKEVEDAYGPAHELQSLHEYIQERVQVGRQKIKEFEEIPGNYSAQIAKIEAKSKVQIEKMLGHIRTRITDLAEKEMLKDIKPAITAYKALLVAEDILNKPEVFKTAFEQTIEAELKKREKELLAKLDAKRKVLEDELQEAIEDYVQPAKDLKTFLEDSVKFIEDDLKKWNLKLEKAIREANGQADTIRKKIKEIRAILNLIKAPKKKEINYTWKTSSFSEVDLGIVQFIPKRDPKTKLQLDVKNTVHYKLELDKPPKITDIDSSTVSRFTNFDLNFLQMITVSFSEISFVGGTGVKEKFDVKISDVKFDGMFNFVEIFQEWLQTVDKGLILDVSANKAELGYLLPIPDIAAGAFNFANAKLSMGLNLYFEPGKPMLFSFGMNHPKEMFLVTAGIFGGRGCFLLGVEPGRGIVEVLLVIEFGGVLYLNLGVAKGIVYLMAGIYFRKRHDQVELRGYLTCGGALRIIGLVTASITFYMGLHGTGDGRNLKGTAKASYKVKIGRWFERRVTMQVDKQIKGASGGNKSMLVMSEESPRLVELVDQFKHDTDKKFYVTDNIVLSYLAEKSVDRMDLIFEDEQSEYRKGIQLHKTVNSRNEFYLESPFVDAMIGRSLTVRLIETVKNEDGTKAQHTAYERMGVKIFTNTEEELQQKTRTEWKEYLHAYVEL